jgi:hypothetical protein
MPAKISGAATNLKAGDFLKPNCSVYMPKEGLQGEDIPSHILWENATINSIEISFGAPFRLKGVFNCSSPEICENRLTVKTVELNGYLGLSFETSKVKDIEVELPVGFRIQFSSGEVIEETKRIRLFKPQLKVVVPASHNISVDSATGFIKGRLSIKNVGRGLILMRINSTEDSQTKLETPLEYREFAEKFNADIGEELTKLANQFPQFKPFLDYTLSCGDKESLSLTMKEREELARYLTSLANTLANDKALMQGFVEAYAKALAKNTQFIESIRKVVTVYESLVSKDILLLNPLDEVILMGKDSTISLAITLTDNIFDNYKDMELPRINIKSEQGVRIPIYKLVEWG